MPPLLALTALLLGAPAADRWAVAVGPLVKVRPHVLPTGTGSAQLLLARGECEGVQLVARPPAREVNATVFPPAAAGELLAARLYREAWVEVRTPSNRQGSPGPWPDPLIPSVDAYAGESRSALPFDSTGERPLVLYLELCAPRAQRPGTYLGAVVLRARGLREQRIAISAEVLPFQLPASSSLANSFGLSRYTLAKGHGMEPGSAAAAGLLRRYATALLAHRLSAYGMSMDPPPARLEGTEVRVDFSAYDEEMSPFLEGERRFSSTDLRDWLKAPSHAARVAYYRAFLRHFQEKGWKARLFLYAKDEPRPEDYPAVREQARLAREAGLPVLLTSPLDEAIHGAADILAPPLNCFFPRPGLPTCRRIAAARAVRASLRPGASVWWYQSCLSHGCQPRPAADPAVEQAFSGWASYMVDHPAAHNRAMGPLAYLAGVAGELYFDTAHAFIRQDPWEDVFDFGGNGEGTLFYPGTPERVGGASHFPVESLRLKHLRDGLEDYEYLLLAERLGEESLAKDSARALTRSGYQISADPERWRRTRERLARRIAVRWQREYGPGSRVGQ